MSWLDALDKLFKAKKFYDAYKKVEKVHDYSKKVTRKKPEDLTWDDLKFFNNKQMDEATKNVRQALSAADAALSAEMDWPDPQSGKIFMQAMKLSAKYGADSPDVKKMLAAYRVALITHDVTLKALKAAMQARNSEISDKATKAKAISDYARVLEDAFLKCAEIPSLTGTAQNAMFFSLSQDASQLAGLAGSLHARLGKLADKNAKLIGEAGKKIRENKLWIDWANSSSPQKEGNIKSNQRAARPKR